MHGVTSRPTGICDQPERAPRACASFNRGGESAGFFFAVRSMAYWKRDPRLNRNHDFYRTHYNPPKANNGSNWKSNRDGDGIPPDGLEAKAAAAVTDQKKTVEKGGGEGGGKDDKNNNSNKDSWKLKYAKIVKRRNTIAEVAASPEAASAGQ